MTGPEIVHPVGLDGIEEWTRLLVRTLLHEPYGDEFDYGLARRRRLLVPDRTWGVRDRGQWVGTLATLERNLTVPGPDGGTNDLTVDALTAVSVSATHRRRGLLRTMLEQSLLAAKDRGDPLSMLVAAEWPIYGRFGYAPAVDGAGYRLHTRRAGGVAGANSRSVRPVDLAEAAAVAPDVFDRERRRRAGGVDRRPLWWSTPFGMDGAPPAPSQRTSWFVHDGPDGVDGVVSWKTTRGFDLEGPLGRIEVGEFLAATDAAYRDLWGYLASLDVVQEVDLGGRPADEPVRFLLHDARALQTREVFDFVWLRLLDVPAALAARAYGAETSVVLDVVDPCGPGYGAGRYRLDTGVRGAACAPTTSAPDLRLDQRDLAAAYLGGHALAELAIIGRIEELTPGAVARTDLAFATPLRPWNQTGF